MMKLFVAGATGALGKRLIPLLHERRHEVFAMTRSQDKVLELERAGVRAVVADAFDKSGLRAQLLVIRPDIVFHELTDLPFGTKPDEMVEGTKRNARMRREGTRNVVAAALSAGAQKMIAQSIAWVYAPGREPHVEEDALDTNADEPRRTTVHGVVELERQVLQSPPLQGVVLRYGHLYGPATGHDTPEDPLCVHVDAAAFAAVLAIDAAPGTLLNVTEDNQHVSNAKARAVLGWTPEFRLGVSRSKARRIRQYLRSLKA